MSRDFRVSLTSNSENQAPRGFALLSRFLRSKGARMWCHSSCNGEWNLATSWNVQQLSNPRIGFLKHLKIRFQFLINYIDHFETFLQYFSSFWKKFLFYIEDLRKTSKDPWPGFIEIRIETKYSRILSGLIRNSSQCKDVFTLVLHHLQIKLNLPSVQLAIVSILKLE